MKPQRHPRLVVSKKPAGQIRSLVVVAVALSAASIGYWLPWSGLAPRGHSTVAFAADGASETGPAGESSFSALAQGYSAVAQTALQKFCADCHTGESHEGEFDLARFATFDEVRRRPQDWQKVDEMLRTGEMPPADAAQPSDQERRQLHDWVKAYLSAEAKAGAGDPGPIVLRRLSNAEYTYTLRDLTGIASLSPAREFPVDGAAGEGFTNAGAALVMSPALVTKYLDAAKEVANHAVLLPDEIRFSPSTTRRDWTDEKLNEIREFYGRFSDSGGGERVNLQGIVFDTNQGGRLPIEAYLAATLAERESIASGKTSIVSVANERGLNAKYLGILWRELHREDATGLIGAIAAKWRRSKADDLPSLLADIGDWQKQLFRFAAVGHIGKVNGPQRWLEEIAPLVDKQELRLKIPVASGAREAVISLVATDAGDGNADDHVVWRRPRLVAPGRPELLLRDAVAVASRLAEHRRRLFAATTKYLSAANAVAANPQLNLEQLAGERGLDASDLRDWLDYLGIGAGGDVELRGHFVDKIERGSGYDFVNGWGRNETPNLVANSSDQHVRIPGNLKPHSVAAHPSPELCAAIGWRSPLTANVRIEGTVTHAHPECGNGVTWSLELRRGAIRQRLAAGVAQGGQPVSIPPQEQVAIRAGDLVSLLIGPRDRNHACDLTAVDLQLSASDGRVWNLAGDVSSDIHAGNPHADRFGNPGVWHFYTEPDGGANPAGAIIPADSLLARWQRATELAERDAIASELERFLLAALAASEATSHRVTETASDQPDGALYRQMAAYDGPLLGAVLTRLATAAAASAAGQDYLASAPQRIEFRLPAELASGYELVVEGMLDDKAGDRGSVQLQVVAGDASDQPRTTSDAEAPNSLRPGLPVVAAREGAARQRAQAMFDEFRKLFPPALCYVKIVPVDEVVTLTLFYREDDHLARLMLSDAERAHLDRLWDQLHFVSQDALTLVDAFAQLMEYATQDADPSAFAPLKEPIHTRAAAFRQQMIDAEPKQLSAAFDFAQRAWRRGLNDGDRRELRDLYRRLREQEIPHDEATRLLIARILIAPAFLYRLETPAPGPGQAPISRWELASRLSYFLWSSLPDGALRQRAAAGDITRDDVLEAQTERMLRDGKIRRLATEFACQWLHVYDFDQLDEKSERHFPTFAGLRGAMHEETILFFADLFARNGSVLEILDADHTFVNGPLAEHYGLVGISGDEHRRVDGVKAHARGGILAHATTLAKQSGASRTSPILRGNWISEVLLGERLPRPPKGVPQLPDDETATAGLTVRQLVERHSSDPKCAVCHRRVDPFGFALEEFDAIGGHRQKDLADRPIDAHAQTMDGAEFTGLDGLRRYLLTTRRDAFVRQFCRKLLGYALGRSVQLTDEPLLAQMRTDLEANDFRVGVAIRAIVHSPQFREIRGRDAVAFGASSTATP